MRYLSEKVIKGRAYYYLQYRGYSKSLGAVLPEDIKKAYFEFFVDVSTEEYKKIPKSVKDDFKYGDLASFEKNHFYYACIKSELFARHYILSLYKFSKLFTYHSNRQEGSRVTKEEIEAIAELKIKKPRTLTEWEVKNSFAAFNYAISDEMNWNMKNIKHIHYLLLQEINPLIAGEWKQENNVAPGNQMTTDYKKVPENMKKLLEWYRLESKKKNSYPPSLALQFYIKFESIHPFLDGNGRVGRILLNAILHKFDYPFVIFFSENAKQHTDAIRQAREGRWSKLYKHFLEQAKKTDKILFS